jgi:2-polyprenyl-3-methyl-5-hydroxy-6-metoxy-1,4-benzoquinol methylase
LRTKHEVFRHPVSQLAVKQKYDVATLWGVIEHLEKPGDEVRAIRQILHEEGLLFVYTGNRKTWLPKFLCKKWWWHQGMHI